MSRRTRLPRRGMFIWQLAAAVEADGSAEAMAGKARAAGIDAIFVKIAEGVHPYRNTEGAAGGILADLRRRCAWQDVAVWGWHVPRCPAAGAAPAEAAIVAGLAARFDLDGLIMNAEPGAGFFGGDLRAADAYGGAMREAADRLGRPLGICGPALPHADPSWPGRFERIAARADVNLPQLYYGAYPSLPAFLAETEAANARFGLPLIPVGAAWIGADGGCETADDCAGRAREFIALCRARSVQGLAFWHWAAAPPEFWKALESSTA